MSKRLPYYQFESAKYLSGNVMCCTYGAQGVFAILCALYWQRDCNLTLEQANKRIKGADDLLQELESEDIIKINDGEIIILFLDEQYNERTKKAKINSENGAKGAKKRWGNSEIIATPSKIDSESIAFRRDKIREEEIIEDIYIYTESDFLERWKKARLHFDNKPTNISKLLPFEKVDFDNLKKTYDAEQFDQAINGLFFQETYPAIRLRPTHFLQLQNFEKYLTCWQNQIKMFNKPKVKKFIDGI